MLRKRLNLLCLCDLLLIDEELIPAQKPRLPELVVDISFFIRFAPMRV